MQPEELAAHFEAREQELAPAFRRPELHKVCAQCWGLMPKKVPVCVFCGAYRFVEEPGEVLEMAKLLALTPWPRRAPYIPRLKQQESES